jgi:hypothetical protein
MEKLVADNEYLNFIADKTEKFIKVLQVDADKLRNKDSDQFERYMAWVRLSAYFEAAEMVVKVSRTGLSSGHDINHPALQTPSAINGGWGQIKIKDNPFFVQEDDDDDEMVSETTIETELKKIFPKHIVIEVMKQIKE